MRALITGANGFLGKNLQVYLREKDVKIELFTRQNSLDQLRNSLVEVDFIFHLAGVNRPLNSSEFVSGNKEFTEHLCNAIRATGRQIPIVYASSIQAEMDSLYGLSKRDAEQALVDLEKETGSPVYIYRLPNVFGKWSLPNYNSVVATFCHNVINGIPISIHDREKNLNLVYVDDVMADFLKVFSERTAGFHQLNIDKVYAISLGDLADQIYGFRSDRKLMMVGPVGAALTRALYSTYLSFLNPENFSYSLEAHSDSRGKFVEILKTRDSGQFSFFTALPGVTRGGHYHHSKNEKFLVLRGKACFRFCHTYTNERFELFTDAEEPQIVETVPGWAHDITNVGSDEIIVMLWANELFNPQLPDTVRYKV